MLFSLVGPGYHYEHYFDTTGVTLKETNGEFTETCHFTLKKEEATHGLQNVRKIGTPIHQYRGLKVLTIHNSTKIGGSEICKKSSRSSTPSPLYISSPTEIVAKQNSPFDKNFLHRYPAAVATHNSNKYK